MSDSFSETSSEGWFSRIGGAIKGMLIGGLLFLISFPLLFWNEGRAVKTAASLDEGERVTVEAPLEQVAAENQDKLIHVSGLATTADVVRDDQFNIEANAIRLRRVVEMYQWDEDVDTETKKKVGGGKETKKTYSYNKKWSSNVIDSSRFKRSGGHENPGSMPVSGSQFKADQVTVGAYKLTPSMVDRISGSEPLAVSQDNIPEAFAERMVLSGANELYISQSSAPGQAPGSPEVGDTRIRFNVTNPAEITVVAKQKGETFGAFETSNGYTIDMQRMGLFDIHQMYEMARTDNTIMTWILRAAGTLAMFIGLMMLMRPIAVLGDVIPFIGSIVAAGSGIVAFAITLILAPTVIAIAWIFYRPLLAIGLLAIAAGGVYLLMRLRKPKEPAAKFAGPQNFGGGTDVMTEDDVIR